MNTLIFLNCLSLGGTEKAACRWARGLQEKGHVVSVLALAGGPRQLELAACGIPVRVVDPQPALIAKALRAASPEVIHAHTPGYPHVGDILGDALKLLPGRIPVVLTNVFGRLQNPRENQWGNFRLFVSWTSCVQAAQRSFQKLDKEFFRRASVAVYPLDPVEPAVDHQIAAFRNQLGIASDDILFGRLSRPEPNKWTNLALDAFRLALRQSRKIKLLLREPPPLVAAQLRAGPDADRFVIMPTTSDVDDLRLTMSALDVVLHTSSIGESFGYGIAEPMNLGKPVITHSVPWEDQAQIELARHGECGFITSTPGAMAAAMTTLAEDTQLRQHMGWQARKHIRTLADPNTSVNRLEAVLRAAIDNKNNPFADTDLAPAQATAAYLSLHKFGHSWREQLVLRPFYYRVRFNQLRRAASHKTT